jgi:hypothetical protein
LKIKIHYPFHPFYGKELGVICRSRNKEGWLTLAEPSGNSLKIPVWMTNPEAERHHMTDKAEVSIESILSLLAFLERKMKT